MNRTARWALAIVLLQAALVGAYWLVESGRRTTHGLGTEPPRAADGRLPSFRVLHRDGTRGALALSEGRTLLHIWATWCPPCRAELPALLALPRRHDVAVVAIALDPSWDAVDAFLNRDDSGTMALATSAEVERALGVHALPVTFLVEGDGQIIGRFDGARDWTDQAFVQTYVGAVGEGP